jgi:hypothetical protein
MTNDSDTNSDKIIDLDADQVIEDVTKHQDNTVPPPARPAPRRWNWAYVAVALLAAAVAGGWFYKELLASYLPSDQMQAMTDKVAVLETGTSQLREELTSVGKLAAQLKSDIDVMEGKDAELSSLAEAAQKSQNVTSDKLTVLEQGLADARQSVADLASRPVATAGGVTVPVDTAAITALQRRIDGLEKDVASLKAKPAEDADNRAALSQALSDLKVKIAEGTGYAAELDRIQRMVPAASGLDVLQQRAALGLPNAKGLGGELRSLIGSLPKPIIPGPVPESQSWWSGIYESLSGLITIKVDGDVDWPSAASAAAALADSGDLSQAIEQINKIEGPKPAGVQQWLDRANGRIALETALKSVEDAVLRVIAAKG